MIGQQLTRRMTVAVPSFNEYEEVVGADQLHRFPLDPETFELDIDAFAEATIRSDSNIAVVVSPNNPTSISVPREGLLDMAERLGAHDRVLIVDESFIDFSAAAGDESLESVVGRYPNLVILKSMSKVFGVAGPPARLPPDDEHRVRGRRAAPACRSGTSTALARRSCDRWGASATSFCAVASG